MNNILCIPKHKININNGYTPQKTDPYIVYGSYFILLNESRDLKLFYRIIPFLIFESEGYYLVNEYDKSKYTLNICDPNNYIDSLECINPIKNSIDNYFKTYVLKSKVSYNKVKYIGAIKDILNNPNDIVFLYKKNIDTKDKIIKKKYSSNYKWYNLEELVNKARKFDGFSMYYIDYLIGSKIKRR